MPETVRVTAYRSAALGGNLEFFAVTGSSEAPIVCLADNFRFPWVRDFYARAIAHQGLLGVHVPVRFEGTTEGDAFAANIFQPNMTGNYRVIPLV